MLLQPQSRHHLRRLYRKEHHDLEHQLLSDEHDPAAAAAPAGCSRLPAHGDSAVRRTPEVDQGARSGDGSGQDIMLVAQKTGCQGRADAGGHVRHRLRRQHPADAEAARRHREGAGRRRAARAHRTRSRSSTRTSSCDAARRSPPTRTTNDESRSDAPRDRSAVRPVREAQQEDPAGDPDVAVGHRRRGPPGRHHRRAPAAQARAEAGRSSRCSTSPSASSTCSAQLEGRDRHPAGRKAHPWPRQAPDGEEPARVLPERAGQGDPEGTRRRRRGRRPRRAREEASRPRACRRKPRTRPRPSSRSSS